MKARTHARLPPGDVVMHSPGNHVDAHLTVGARRLAPRINRTGGSAPQQDQRQWARARPKWSTAPPARWKSSNVLGVRLKTPTRGIAERQSRRTPLSHKYRRMAAKKKTKKNGRPRKNTRFDDGGEVDEYRQQWWVRLGQRPKANSNNILNTLRRSSSPEGTMPSKAKRALPRSHESALSKTAPLPLICAPQSAPLPKLYNTRNYSTGVVNQNNLKLPLTARSWVGPRQPLASR
jgi:hypothetical protein